MTVLAWNILHGGGPGRLPEIALAIGAERPDLCVLSEFRVARGGQLRAVLADQGLVHQAVAHGPDRLNGVLVACKAPIRDIQAIGGRWLDAAIPQWGLSLTAVHIPDDTHPGPKAEHWQRLIALARLRRNTHHLIIGDVNTGRRGQDADSGCFHCEALLGTLWSLGYQDAWRAQNPQVKEPTWVAPWGEGRRIDAAYLSPPLFPVLESAVHLQEPREQGWSDHAALRLDIQLGIGRIR